MSFSPFTEDRIRTLQANRADRDAKRSEEAAKQTERERKSNEFYAARDAERRQSISPNEVTAAERHVAACEYYANLHAQEQEREKTKQRNRDIEKMATLKAEWDKAETTPARKTQIVYQYADLYSKYVPGTTPEATLKYWEGERRKALLQRLYGAYEAAV